MKIGYARVSTRSQSPEAQIAALNEYGCITVYHETISGNKKNALINRVLEDMQRGDELVVCKLDRICRSLKHFLEIMETLKKKGIELKVLHEHVDTETAMGETMMKFSALLGEMERTWISERTKKALAAKKAKGIIGGRKKGITAKTLRQQMMATYMRDNEKRSYKEIAKTFDITQGTARIWIHKHRKRDVA